MVCSRFVQTRSAPSYRTVPGGAESSSNSRCGEPKFGTPPVIAGACCVWLVLEVQAAHTALIVLSTRSCRASALTRSTPDPRRRSAFRPVWRRLPVLFRHMARMGKLRRSSAVTACAPRRHPRRVARHSWPVLRDRFHLGRGHARRRRPHRPAGRRQVPGRRASGRRHAGRQHLDHPWTRRCANWWPSA